MADTTEPADVPAMTDLQLRWAAATTAYWYHHRVCEQAEKDRDAARQAMEASEQTLGKAIAAQLTNEAYDHQGNALVTIGGRLLRVIRSSRTDHYYVRSAEVVRL
jgi:hypothetical protein